MFSAASKGERRNLRGSARFSSKMSGRLSRLRALRPRSQQQRVRTAVIADATRKLEANLKEMTTSHEEENTVAKKCDLKRTEKGADIANTVSEMDDNDDDDELTMITTEKNEEAVRDDDIAINSEETTNFETSQQDSYECKSCKPSKTLPNMTAYLEHLQKEHKVSAVSAVFFFFLFSIQVYPRICYALFCALVFVSFYFLLLLVLLAK